jgi:hypothetical protein
MGGSPKRGRWRVSERLNAVTVMGGAEIDLREGELDGDVVVITAVALMGGVEIYLPDSVEVDVGGVALMGGTEMRGSTRPARPGAPLVRIRAFPIMGGVEVQTPRPAPSPLGAARSIVARRTASSWPSSAEATSPALCAAARQAAELPWTVSSITAAHPVVRHGHARVGASVGRQRRVEGVGGRRQRLRERVDAGRQACERLPDLDAARCRVGALTWSAPVPSPTADAAERRLLLAEDRSDGSSV